MQGPYTLEVQCHNQVKDKSLGWSCRGKEESGRFHSLIVRSINYRNGEVRTSLIARAGTQFEFL